jgi:hypothetical protein
MSPSKGSVHRRARSDSGAVRLWDWARGRRGSWTCAAAAEAADITSRRAREIVRALHAAELVECIRETETLGGGQGQSAAEWAMSAAGRAVKGAPVLIVDGKSGRIVGVRAATDGDGAVPLRRAVERSKLPLREAARRLKVNDTTLRAMLRGDQPISADDAIIKRARAL